jgi:hypothetical protein
MKCWHGDHDELRRGDFIYRGAAGMGVLECFFQFSFNSKQAHGGSLNGNPP